MSVKVMGCVWDCESLDGPRLLAMLALADFAADDGTNVFPSVKTLARKMRIKERQTQYILRQLEAEGWIGCVRNHRGGIGKSRHYQINVQKLKGAENCTVQENKGCSSASSRVQFHNPKGAVATAPEPLYPSDDPSVSSRKGNKRGTKEDLETARQIFSGVRVVVPTAKEPSWPEWANDIRLMREQDSRTHHDILDLFQWANKHDFWAANILSPRKLRAKWNTLTAQRNRGSHAARQHVDNSAVGRVRSANRHHHGKDITGTAERID